MAQQFEKVRPGDLIKSDFFNRLMEALESLQGRVDKLEAVSGGNNPGKVVITQPNSSQTFHIGGQLKIIGKNFGLPSQNVVTLEEKIIDTFETGSGDQLLIIKTIPNVQNIPQNGREVTLLLSNAIGNAETTFTLAQPAIDKPTGTLKTNLSSSFPPTEPIEANKSPIFTFTISAITSMDDNYLIEPKVDIGWQAQFVDSQGTPVIPPELKIEKGPQPTVATVKDVKIRVAIPQNAPNNQIGKLSLTVRSKLNPQLKDTTEETTLKVGGPPPEADQIGISVSSVVFPGGRSGNDLLIPPAAIGKNVTAKFTATVDEAAMYEIATPTFSPNPGNIWSAEIVGVNPVAMATPEDKFTIKVHVPTADKNPAATNMTLLVTKDDDPDIKGDRDIKILIT